THGDDDVTGDEVTTLWTYVPNTTAFIVNRPATQRTYAGTAGTGAKLTESLIHYDGAASESVAPTQGYLTKTRTWLDSEGRYVSRLAVFDSYGNMTSSTDATNRTATTA